MQIFRHGKLLLLYTRTSHQSYLRSILILLQDKSSLGRRAFEILLAAAWLKILNSDLAVKNS